MLEDAILKEATAEVERFLLSTVPEGGEPHEFSPEFERKMQKLTRRANHPVRYRLIRVALVAILASLVLIGTVLAVSPEAREAAARWIRGGISSQVTYRGKDPENVGEDLPVYDYRLTYIPEGYHEEKTLEEKIGRAYIYENEEGLYLSFSYTRIEDGSQMIIRGLEDDEYRTGFVNGHAADIYISSKEGDSSTIVWEDEETHVLFTLFAHAGVEELIKLAESVERID